MSCIRSCYDKDSSNFGHDDCPTCIHKDAPPQRTWVGLDNDDLIWIYSNSDKVGQAISNTEAKLKEKNT